MVIKPWSPNSSLRSLARASAVSIPTASRRSSVSRNSAPRGTAIVSGALIPARSSGSSPAQLLLRDQRLVHALDLERPADGRQRAAEAPEQLVVAPTATQRD